MTWGCDVEQHSGKNALRELMAGNKRYAKGHPSHPNQTKNSRYAVAKDQQPSVVVVGCSDSRVPPTIIFDQGLGYIFEVRTAGHVIDVIAMGSIEYAVAHLGTQLILVLGHTQCGAVTFALKGKKPKGNLGAVIEELLDLSDEVRGNIDDPVGAAIEANVRNVMDHLTLEEPVTSNLVSKNRVIVVGAVYDIVTGRVRFLK
jgi:carbonic anhydrase